MRTTKIVREFLEARDDVKQHDLLLEQTVELNRVKHARLRYAKQQLDDEEFEMRIPKFKPILTIPINPDAILT